MQMGSRTKQEFHHNVTSKEIHLLYDNWYIFKLRKKWGKFFNIYLSQQEVALH